MDDNALGSAKPSVAILPPKDLKCIEKTHKTIALEWTPVGAAGATFILYKDSQPLYEMQPIQTSVEVGDLAPGQAYDFKLTAKVGGQESDFSESLNVATKTIEEQFEAWRVKNYVIGDEVRYVLNDVTSLWRCRQAHNSGGYPQTPPQLPALWLEFRA